MKVTGKQFRPRLVDVEIQITSARLCCTNCKDGLWQSLKRKSAISRKPFPVGSNIVLVMYMDDKGKASGAVHLEELPEEIQAVVTRGAVWVQPAEITP